MVGKWLVVLPLLVDFNKVGAQPVTEEDSLRRPRQLDVEGCCPCPNPNNIRGLRDQDESADINGGLGNDCPCQPRSNDAEASPSILRPALKAFQPFVKQSNQKSEPKPLLQPEVGLASSVLETLRQATDEEYQDALARDAARSAVQLLESDILPSLSDTILETPNNIVRIFVNSKEDEMDDNLPEPSHIQETRCIHSPMVNFKDMGQLRKSQPPTIIEVFNSPRKPLKKMKTKKLLHRNHFDMDNSLGASNVQEHVVQPSIDSNSEGDLKSTPFSLNLFPQYLGMPKKNKDIVSIFGSKLGDDEIKNRNRLKTMAALPVMRQYNRPIINFKAGDADAKADNEKSEKRRDKMNVPSFDIKKYFPSTTRLPPLRLQPIDGSLFRAKKPFGLQDLLKLKDIELIPPKDLIKNKVSRGELYPNFKSPTILNLKNINKESDKCGNEDMNQEPSSNTDINNVVSSEVFDSFTSPTNSVPTIDIDNNEPDVINTNNEDFTNNGFVTSSSNGGIPIGDSEETPKTCLNDQDNIESVNRNDVFTNTKGFIENEDEPNEKLSNNNSEHLPDDENGIPTKQDQHHDIDRDLSSEEKGTDVYQIELIDDQDLMVRFDNNSAEVSPTADHTQNFNNIEDSNGFQTILKDNIADTSRRNFQSIQKTDETPLQNEQIDCSPEVEPSQHRNDVTNENLARENVVFARNSMDSQQIKDSVNVPSINSNKQERLRAVSDLSNSNICDISNIENDPSDQISFRDLQEMSDSILNQSECMFDKENTDDIRSSNEIKDFVDEFNDRFSTLPTTNAEDIKIMEMQDASIENSNFNTNEAQLDITNDKIKQDTCNTLFMNDNMQQNNFKDSFVNSNNEMTAAASEPSENSFIQTNLKLSEPNELLLDDVNQTKILNHNNHLNVPKNAEDISDSSFKIKQTKIFENLKSKIENLFSTPEKHIDSDNSLPEADSINESSNMKPIITSFDTQKSLNEFQRTPIKIPEFGLNTRKSKLAIPKSLEKTVNVQQTLNSRITPLNPSMVDRRKFGNTDNQQKTHILRNNAPNFLTSPFDLTRNCEDTIDPSSAISDLSEKLRSHTENTFQNVKETLESRLKEAQVVGLGKPIDKIETQDILESISNRRDELNDKLQALHSDFNDRLSSFHQSILERLNEPFPRNSELQEDGTGVRQTFIPFNQLPSLEIPKQESQSKPIKSKNLGIDLPRTVNIPKANSDEKIFNLPKISQVSGVPRLHNVQKIKPSLRQEDGISRGQQSNINRNPHMSKPTITFATTTPRATFSTKPKTIKAIDTSRSITDSPINVLKSKIPVPREGHKLESRPHLHKPEMRINTKGQYESPPQIPSSRIPLSYNPNSRESLLSVSAEESSINTLESKVKNILQRNQDLKSRSDTKKSLSKWPLTTTKLMKTLHSPRTRENLILNRMREVNRGDGNLDRHNDSDFQMDTTHSAAGNIENIRLVEPLKENVPYKCKLICYKDA